MTLYEKLHNDFLDITYPNIMIAGVKFSASRILYELDREVYENSLACWMLVNGLPELKKQEKQGEEDDSANN